FNFRIDLASAESNNFYIDDINIDLTANAVDELEELRSSLNIYPNPASSVLNIEFEQYVPREAETWLTDVVGKTVTAPKTITAVTGTNHLSTDVSALTAGFYTLHLKTAGGTVTRSFVVQP
ncbi:MAG: T9SS type A sorting domain-containing protein, partial [Bacteroidota bacterium]